MQVAQGDSTRRADLHARFRTVWKRQTAWHLLRAVCHVAAWGIGLVFVVLALDWWLDLPGALRAGALAALVAALAWVAYRRGVRHVRRHDPLRTALRLEAEHAPMDSLLVAYVELDEARPPAGISGALIAAARREAQRRAAPLPLERTVRFAALRRPAAIAVVAVAALAAFGAARWPFLSVFARRMLHPSADLGYPTRTHLLDFTGDLTVKQFDPVEVVARAGGEVPEAGLLYVKTKGADWERIELARADKSEFRHLFPRVPADFRYYFRIGDVRSRRAGVTVARPPRIVTGRIRLDYPKYTGLGREESETFNLRLPEGTTIGWRLELDRPVDAAELATEDGNVQPMALAEGARVAQLDLPAAASTSYRFRFHWRPDSRPYVHEGVMHFIRVVPDQPPAVDLLFPAEDEKATLKKTLALAFVARDDWGLSDAWIVYSLNDFGERRQPLAALGGRRTVERTDSWKLTDTFPDLKASDIVTYWIEVNDGCSGRDGPQVGRSRSRRVQMVSDEDYLAYVQELYQKCLGQVRPLYLRERDSLKRLDSLLGGRAADAAWRFPKAGLGTGDWGECDAECGVRNEE
jgi:hypothetical protein